MHVPLPEEACVGCRGEGSKACRAETALSDATEKRSQTFRTKRSRVQRSEPLEWDRKRLEPVDSVHLT